MGRDITDLVKTEIIKKEIFPILIVRLETSVGNVLAWSGVGNLLYEGELYYGIGSLGKISPVEESGDEIKADAVTFELSGIPSELISLALNAEYQGRSIELWLGLMSNDVLIVDPIMIFAGQVDVMAINEGPETSTISVTAENRLTDLNRARIRRYTSEDQQIDYPDDLFFDFVPSIQNIEVVWRGA